MIDPAAADALYHAGGEIAFIDVREAGQFGEAHPLFAIPLPYSTLETRALRLVPRLDVPVMIMDAGDGIAPRAAERMAELGYTDLHVIYGGMPAWEAAGLGVYKGVNVPSKTLGELAETIWHPTMITAPELADWSRNRRDFRFFDARPPAEYGKMRVPGSVCLPNGELAHRIATFADAKASPVVITCAGRTRGIVGAIGMRIAGHEGEVLALENGTQGWALAGENLDRGATADAFPALDDAALAASTAAADRVMTRFSIPEVTMAEAAAMLCEPDRTTYLLDTRSAPEAARDPVRGAVHAPSGQLAQATDQWVATARARLILCCDTGLRSALAAFWLKQLGYDVHVARLTDTRDALPDGAPDVAAPGVKMVEAREALAAMDGGARLFDLRPSMSFRKEHARGAMWACRPTLTRDAARHAPGLLMLIADDDVQAAWIARDLIANGISGASVVTGGHAALVAAGAATEASPDTPADADCIDHLFFVHDRHDGNLEASRQYLAWETGLIAQLNDRERAAFKLLGP
jgi:rhodanese-related sulfurtransferase